MSNTVNRFVATLFVFGLLLVNADTLRAAVPPRDIDQLRQADLIVVGVIDKVMVQPEPSRVERGFGNYDWGIYLTVSVETVEKGDLSQPEIEVRCFRIKSRRSAAEYLSVSGHDPIPGAGTKVRAYLNRTGGSWAVVIPNGITPHNADTSEAVWPDGSLGQANELAGLSGLMYTYLLPLELWGLVFFVLLPIVFCVFCIVRYWRRGKRSCRGHGSGKDESESSG
ncbi:MAG TPA: hypothetical protein DEF45_12430 [Rhodopirellula sp.]|nr:MAG: hypothetical protein CBD74_07280 [Saprospirales bacterium TMED214]HBV63817.1 hypothetical protein [Rhodopirellula sp.]